MNPSDKEMILLSPEKDFFLYIAIIVYHMIYFFALSI